MPLHTEAATLLDRFRLRSGRPPYVFLSLTRLHTRKSKRDVSTEVPDLVDNTRRTFLADGDEVFIKAFCEKPGTRRIGFGEGRAVILPA